jgi:hypothetical protein
MSTGWDGVDFYYTQFVTGYVHRGLRDGEEVSNGDLGGDGSFVLHYKEKEYDGNDKEQTKEMLDQMEKDGYPHIAKVKEMCGVS